MGLTPCDPIVSPKICKISASIAQQPKLESIELIKTLKADSFLLQKKSKTFQPIIAGQSDRHQSLWAARKLFPLPISRVTHGKTENDPCHIPPSCELQCRHATPCRAQPLEGKCSDDSGEQMPQANLAEPSPEMRD